MNQEHFEGEGVGFYRCVICSTVIPPWTLREEGCCPHCGGHRVKPTNLGLWEKVVQVAKRPAVWRWREDSFPPD